MVILRFILLTFLILISVYTILTIQKFGFSFSEVFFGNISRVNWQGQFNLDFLLYIILASLWILWKNKYSFVSFVFIALHLVGGMHFLAGYLLYLSLKNKSLEEILVRK